MKALLTSSFLLLLFSLSGCAIVEGIFKVGVWVGIMASAVVVGLVIYLIMKLRRK